MNLDDLRAITLEGLLAAQGMEFDFELTPEYFNEAAPEFIEACTYLGTEFLVDRARGGPEMFEQLNKLVSSKWLFAIGWKILYDEVIMSTAQSVLDLIDKHEDKKDSQLLFLKRALEKAIRDGQPWNVQSRLDPISSLVGEETAEAFKRLIGKYPSMPANDGPIRSMEQIQAIFLFVSEVGV